MITTRKLSEYPRREWFQNLPDACPGCSMPIILRLLLKAMEGKVSFVSCAGCSQVVFFESKSKDYRLDYRGDSISSLWVPFGQTARCAGGLKRALVAKGDTDTQVVVWAGDGAFFDIGLGGLSAAAHRNEDIICVCIDNEAYQNTGNQASSATPNSVKTSTSHFPKVQSQQKKSMALIMAAHNIPYYASATLAYPDDFLKKVQKAKNIKGFRFLHIFSPCPTGWGYPSRLTVKLSRLAVKTRIFPLLEIEGKSHVTINCKEPNVLPVDEYIKLQGRYIHRTPQVIASLQKEVDETWDWLEWLESYKRL